MSATRVKFGDVVSNLNETVRQGEEHSLTRVVGLEHIEPQDPDLRRWDELSNLPDGTSFTRVFRRGQVLFGKRRAYQRKVAVAPFDGICSSDILVFAPANKKLHPDFLLYVVQSEGFFSHALQTSSGSLSPRTRWQDLATFEFELPTIEEQQKIVELLSGVDAHAEALRNQLNVAQETRKAVLHHMLTAGGDDWTETTLGRAALVNPKERALSNDERFVPMDAVHVGQRFVQYFESRGLRNGVRARSGDVLFARITPCLENGKVAQVPPHVEVCGGSTEFIVIRGSDVISSDFLYFWSTWADMRSKAADLMTGTSGRQRLSASDLSSIPVFLPPLEEQQRIVDEISKIDVVIQETMSALAATRQLRNALLNKEIS